MRDFLAHLYGDAVRKAFFPRFRPDVSLSTHPAFHQPNYLNFSQLFSHPVKFTGYLFGHVWSTMVAMDQTVTDITDTSEIGYPVY